jgi:glutathionyl-hydroquinone reductase
MENGRRIGNRCRQATPRTVPGVRETVSMVHIKRGYYSIKALNPNGIVPLGPDLSELGL